MLYNFDTDNEQRAKAALILYAIYRSRKKSSSLNGLETWERCKNYIRGACLKSTNIAEFVNSFCKMADVQNIKPYYFNVAGAPVALPSGDLIRADGVNDFKLKIFDDSLIKIFENESIYLILLVRERLQREKIEGVWDDEDEDQD